jgi:ABC-type uncharacterized transport system permease subunit
MPWNKNEYITVLLIVVLLIIAAATVIWVLTRGSGGDFLRFQGERESTATSITASRDYASVSFCAVDARAQVFSVQSFLGFPFELHLFG